jgi:hypothetical protein
MLPIELPVRKSLPNASPLATFVACAHQMLDPSTPEAVRRSVEPLLLAQLPALKALGVFDLFELRDPALRAWLADELEALSARVSAWKPVILPQQT